MPISIKGVIRNIAYDPCFRPAQLQEYHINGFDINEVSSSGLINLGDPGDCLAYSKWITPKRTRSYPFTRIYNTYHLNTKKVTIIPIIKDEGASTNNDRINFITLSWMNLLNIYIILAWYDEAERKPGTFDRITNQTFHAESVRERLRQVSQCPLSALHWNTEHFNRDFESTYRLAVEAYEQISWDNDVLLHSSEVHLRRLDRFMEYGEFSLDAFQEQSLSSSEKAAHRETHTSHWHERLSEDTEKGQLYITNYLGGEYHLTADEVYYEDGRWVLQESKNSRGKFPSENDIKSGLFVGILYSNMEEVSIYGETDVEFITRLKLTGNLIGELHLPRDMSKIVDFCSINRLTKTQLQTIVLLNQEAIKNEKLEVWIKGQDG